MHVRHINMEMFSVTTSVDTLSNDFFGFSDVNRVAFPFLSQAAMCETATHPKKTSRLHDHVYVAVRNPELNR